MHQASWTFSEDVVPEDGAVLTGQCGRGRRQRQAFLFSSCAAEFVAMTLFVILEPGSAVGIAKTEGCNSCLRLLDVQQPDQLRRDA